MYCASSMSVLCTLAWTSPESASNACRAPPAVWNNSACTSALPSGLASSAAPTLR
jgi:hypothetical protein